jgi:FAD/FMN-containing dehydrogenase
MRKEPFQLVEEVMNELNLATLDAGKAVISAEMIDALAGSMKGSVLVDGDAGYDDARTIWNATIDRKPGLIVRCVSAADVANAVRFASDNRLLVAVRGGGHNIAGNAVCEGGLMIDLSQMKAVNVDAGAKRARVGPGATLADVDRETQAAGLALPTGINSTTGIAGLTLGGGFGWITRKYGLTIDNLVAAEVVTADGERVRTGESENPDLFWALRGGGGNFGIVTSFEFKLHEMGPEVLAGLVVHPFADAQSVLMQYRELVANAPEELTCWVVMRKAPPLPFLPEEWHGKEVLILAICYCGDIQAGEEATAALRSIGNPIVDVVGPAPFAAWQQAFDPLLTPGARNYWKSHDLTKLSDAAIDILLSAIRTLPGPECEVFLGLLGGAVDRVATDATAFPHRDTHFVMNVHTRWQDAGADQKFVGWARSLFDNMKPHAAGTAYVNFMPDDERGRVEAAYGGNYKRLASIKKRYDPQNLFRMNQNVTPAA